MIALAETGMQGVAGCEVEPKGRPTERKTAKGNHPAELILGSVACVGEEAG
jgi:hypothetical protein